MGRHRDGKRKAGSCGCGQLCVASMGCMALGRCMVFQEETGWCGNLQRVWHVQCQQLDAAAVFGYVAGGRELIVWTATRDAGDDTIGR